jgi:hypothetical protein
MRSGLLDICAHPIGLRHAFFTLPGHNIDGRAAPMTSDTGLLIDLGGPRLWRTDHVERTSSWQTVQLERGQRAAHDLISRVQPLSSTFSGVVAHRGCCA